MPTLSHILLLTFLSLETKEKEQDKKVLMLTVMKIRQGVSWSFTGGTEERKKKREREVGLRRFKSGVEVLAAVRGVQLEKGLPALLFLFFFSLRSTEPDRGR